jgi:hypothetical protein
MKSAKDFSKAWGVNKCSAGKRLMGKFGNGKYEAVPVMKVGNVPLYSDDDFERLTGIKVKNKVDLTGRICPTEISKIAGIKTNSVFDWLKRNGVEDYIKDCNIRFYKKSDIEELLEKNPPRRGRRLGSKNSAPKKPSGASEFSENALDLDRLNAFTIFNHRIAVLKDGKWVVKNFGAKDGDCLKVILKYIQEGDDVLIRSY